MPEVKPPTSVIQFGARLLTLQGASIRLRDQIVVKDLSWTLCRGEHWVVLGPNGAGKSSFARALTGELAVVRGRIERHGKEAAPSRVGYVSFERHQQLLVRELQNDPAREFSGNRDLYTRTKDILTQAPAVDPEVATLLSSLDLSKLANRGIHQLSTGELRKVLITRTLQRNPGILILDEPFDGLDRTARPMIRKLLVRIMAVGIPTVLITHRREELLPGITHALALRAGRVQFQGSLKKLPTETLPPTFPDSSEDVNSKGSNPSPEMLPSPGDSFGPNPTIKGIPVIRMTDVTVRYGPTDIFRKLNWTVHKHDHWAVMGPNGAGKSTLMALIVADHPQAYANRIHLFGRRRGSGESIWEIKQRIGMVSFEQQVRYQKTITAIEVVLSGFFDSIGLFRCASLEQRRCAEDWTRRLKLGELASRPFLHLSHGERRMVLLARAVVKHPEILILDEPCQGLDPLNRRRVLAEVDLIAKSGSQLIFVTHHPQELPRCITHHLHLSGPRGDGRAKITRARGAV